MKMSQQQIAKVNTLLYQRVRPKRMSPGTGLSFINRAFELLRDILPVPGDGPNITVSKRPAP